MAGTFSWVGLSIAETGTGACIGGRRTGGNFIRNAQQGAQVAYDVGGQSLSGLGVALVMALIATVIAVAPGYVGLSPASVPSDLVLSLAISLWFLGATGLLIELGELRKFVSGLNEEGWENLLVAALFLVPAGAFYLGIGLVEIQAWVELPLKLVSIVLAILGAMFVGATLDSFFIKPKLREITRPKPGSKGGSRGADWRSALGSVATAIAWMLANSANLLVILDQLLPGRTP